VPPSPLTSPDITGAWYDKDHTGSGFNILQTGSGLLVYYYGWDKDGHRLWLANRDMLSDPIVPGTPLTLIMVETQGGTFSAPAKPGTLNLPPKNGRQEARG
jgi:hypothetical protein